MPLGRPKVSNPKPGGRPTVQQTAGSGDPRRTANLKSGSYFRAVPKYRFDQIESLERQTLLAQVSWILAGNGDWNTAANWSTGKVPGTGDDVNIDGASGSYVIAYSSGTSAVNSIRSDG